MIIYERDKKTLYIPSGMGNLSDDEGYAAGYESGYTEGYAEGVESGYTEGAVHQKSLMVETAFTRNQTYERADGWNKVTVNVAHSDTYEQGFEDGVESGRTYQKSLMISTTFGSNGQYREENGYNDFTIAVETHPVFEFSGTFVTTEDMFSTDQIYWEDKSPIFDNGGGWVSYQKIDGYEYDYYWQARRTLPAGTHTYTCSISEFLNVTPRITNDTIEFKDNPFFDWTSGDIKLYMTKND